MWSMWRSSVAAYSSRPIFYFIIYGLYYLHCIYAQVNKQFLLIAIAYNEAVAAASATQYLDMCAHNIEKRGGATHPKRHNIAIKN